MILVSFEVASLGVRPAWGWITLPSIMGGAGAFRSNQKSVATLTRVTDPHGDLV